MYVYVLWYAAVTFDLAFLLLRLLRPLAVPLCARPLDSDWPRPLHISEIFQPHARWQDELTSAAIRVCLSYFPLFSVIIFFVIFLCTFLSFLLFSQFFFFFLVVSLSLLLFCALHLCFASRVACVTVLVCKVQTISTSDFFLQLLHDALAKQCVFTPPTHTHTPLSLSHPVGYFGCCCLLCGCQTLFSSTAFTASFCHYYISYFCVLCHPQRATPTAPSLSPLAYGGSHRAVCLSVCYIFLPFFLRLSSLVFIFFSYRLVTFVCSFSCCTH